MYMFKGFLSGYFNLFELELLQLTQPASVCSAERIVIVVGEEERRRGGEANRWNKAFQIKETA